MASFPIAVLDTGAGGLSVVSAIRRILPEEDIFYFADTAHLPYGIKSPKLIRHLTLKMVEKLVDISSCKILVIACHTMSVWCLKDISEMVSIPVIGMVEPSVQGLRFIMAHKSLTSIGVLSTKATLHSGAYKDAWPLINGGEKAELIEYASGPLVSIVEEEGIVEQDLIIILDRLLPEKIKRCDALLIGCTHFSALIPSLMKVLKPHCHIIDAADFVAEEVRRTIENSKTSTTSHTRGRLIAYVSDNEERFLNIARTFIKEEILVKLIGHRHFEVSNEGISRHTYL